MAWAPPLSPKREGSLTLRRAAALVAPGLAVGDLLGDAALFELSQRVPDRGEGDRHALVALDRGADLGRAQGARCGGLQYLFDEPGIGAALRLAGGCRSPPRRVQTIAGMLQRTRRALALRRTAPGRRGGLPRQIGSLESRRIGALTA